MLKDSIKRDAPRSRSLLKAVFGKSLPLERETCFFILASALDVFMTWILLDRKDFRESNPVAGFFLAHWGIKGMIYFKFALVAFIAVLCQIIAIQKIEVARRVLYFATALVSCVVIYGLWLLLRTSGVL